MYLTAINTKEVLWQEDSIIRMINIDQHCFSDSGWFRVLNDWNYTQPYSNSRESQYEPFNISLLFGYEIRVILPGLLRITEHKSNSLLVSHFQLASMIPIECHKTTFFGGFVLPKSLWWPFVSTWLQSKLLHTIGKSTIDCSSPGNPAKFQCHEPWKLSFLLYSQQQILSALLLVQVL